MSSLSQECLNPRKPSDYWMSVGKNTALLSTNWRGVAILSLSVLLCSVRYVFNVRKKVVISPSSLTPLCICLVCCPSSKRVILPAFLPSFSSSSVLTPLARHLTQFQQRVRMDKPVKPRSHPPNSARDSTASVSSVTLLPLFLLLPALAWLCGCTTAFSTHFLFLPSLLSFC